MVALPQAQARLDELAKENPKASEEGSKQREHHQKWSGQVAEIKKFVDASIGIQMTLVRVRELLESDAITRSAVDLAPVKAFVYKLQTLPEYSQVSDSFVGELARFWDAAVQFAKVSTIGSKTATTKMKEALGTMTPAIASATSAINFASDAKSPMLAVIETCFNEFRDYLKTSEATEKSKYSCPQCPGHSEVTTDS